ncbi:SOS response-associated peptidase [Paenibacillus pini]|uniref:Abasic site processing protein n=1 Tax=Paenibacillus pini JCM 16418 TaxID=1236976 RepID=W7YYT8_9BACL|nr:SOS response-associated peptidase [Paenibacillus pini]GAF07564.1 hypothetical protein JCM16418_1585 [Paenibacillus pini JCM 16418]
MCGRFTLTADLSDITEVFSLIGTEDIDYKPRYNIAPSQHILAISEISGKRVLGEYRWGLVPFWAKDIKVGFSMINARAETIQEKPAYRNLLTRNRVVIPADGFYEWKKEGSDKQPFRFQLDSKKVFGFAGLYDEWKSPAGDTIRSCTIITTKPNDIVQDVHDRMPVILDDAGVSNWLDQEITNKDLLLELLIPYSGDRMISYAVSKEVGNVRNVDSGLIKEISLNSK